MYIAFLFCLPDVIVTWFSRMTHSRLLELCESEQDADILLLCDESTHFLTLLLRPVLLVDPTDSLVSEIKVHPSYSYIIAEYFFNQTREIQTSFIINDREYWNKWYVLRTELLFI